MIAGRRQTGPFDVRCWAGGSGRPLIYLHGFEHHPGAASFLNRLADKNHVVAPEHPGYGSSRGFERLHDIHDVAFYYRRFIEEVGGGAVDVVGHSLGGMFAAELAALAPHLVRRLVLVSPYGLWSDSTPTPDPFVMRPAALAQAKWMDVASSEREPTAYDSAEGGSRSEFRATNLSAATKFMWPIPDRGLSRRLPYVTSPTLIIRGMDDGLFPESQIGLWRSALPAAAFASIPAAGHLPMIEQEGAFLDAVERHLA